MLILEPVKIIFLNTWHGKCRDKLAAFIKRECDSTDIFCFQEADPLAREWFRRLLPEFGEHSYDKPFEGRVRFCVATYVKTPLLVAEERALLAGSYDSGVVQVIRAKTGNNALSVANVHGISFPGNDDKLDTEGRINQSSAIVETLQGTKGPAIIGGDFNLLPETRSIRMFGQAGYQDLVADYHIPTTRNKLAWERFPDSIQRYADYVFVNPGVHVRHFAVPPLEISDHLPLIVEFDVPFPERTQHYTDMQLAHGQQ